MGIELHGAQERNDLLFTPRQLALPAVQEGLGATKCFEEPDDSLPVEVASPMDLEFEDQLQVVFDRTVEQRRTLVQVDHAAAVARHLIARDWFAMPQDGTFVDWIEECECPQQERFAAPRRTDQAAAVARVKRHVDLAEQPVVARIPASDPDGLQHFSRKVERCSKVLLWKPRRAADTMIAEAPARWSSTMAEYYCPDCDGAIYGDQINIGEGVAWCGNCERLIPLAELADYDRPRLQIRIEANRTVRFGSGLREDRLEWVAEVLRTLLLHPDSPNSRLIRSMGQRGTYRFP